MYWWHVLNWHVNSIILQISTDFGNLSASRYGRSADWRESQQSLYRCLGGSHSLSKCFGKDKDALPGYRIEPLALGYSTRSPDTVLTVGLPFFKKKNQDVLHRQYTKCLQVKSVSLQAWSGPQGSRKLRIPDFMTTAQDGGKVVSLTHRPLLPPGNTPGTHFC